ncbi:YczE/YyaS/YitT family protein [Actinopolyspora saharensis]|uniref:membrane protein YczE n=1 Tax=Actinopolyspora saharensis TaxID=995062 RepID=UPI003F667C02
MTKSAPRVDLSSLPVRDRPASRLVQLFAGLVLYGTSMAMMVRSGLGLAPWDVLHEGLAESAGTGFGVVTALIGASVLLLWVPLRQRPGLGTVANVVVVALSVDAALWLLPTVESPLVGALLLVGGVLCNGVATATYVGSRFGPGPRDGLMTGLHERTGLSLRTVRTGLEVAVLVTGWLLGGTVGVGTACYALAVGPLTQLAMPVVAVSTARAGQSGT